MSGVFICPECRATNFPILEGQGCACCGYRQPVLEQVSSRTEPCTCGTSALCPLHEAKAGGRWSTEGAD